MVVIIVNEQQHLRSRLRTEVQLTVHLLRVQGNLFKFVYGCLFVAVDLHKQWWVIEGYRASD